MFNSNLEMIKLFLTAAMKEDNKSVEDTTGGTFTEGEEPYLDDDESYVEPLEGSSSSFQDDYAESIGESRYMETPVPAAEEAEEKVKKKISESFFYDEMELVSMPFVTPDSNIPLDLLTLVYPLQLHMYNLGILAS
uniref:Uncharacterized protein n=3 Tax=Sus scrofa TaxID=9823 RepID=A0A8D0UA69_PIG